MASYTDNIPKFNPYVQTIPVNEMVQVGMYKQQKYEEGIQKIQTNIDNIAGLDVANDADKAYLQSKLNQLGNNLVSVAAGDFSNFQLVNSVNGMTNQIARDSNVQTAVASTAKLRKEQQRKEKAIQDGKSSPENEFVFNMQVSEYLNSSKIGQSFNGQYIEYRDVDKKLRGLVSDLQKAGFEQTIDNPWVRDNLGRDVYFNPDGTQSLDGSKGGTRKFDMVKLTTKIKGVGAERILNNFYDSLDEGDKRQLNITAQYHYRNATPITFQNDIIRTYNEKKKIYSDAIVDATVKLATGNLTPEQKVALENDINRAKKLVFEGGFDIQMREEMAAVDTEAEATAYKYKIYTQKYLTNLAKDLANETKSIEYNSNPGFQALMDKKKFEFDVEKERQREREWQADFALKLKKDRREEEEAERKRKEEVSLQPIVSTEKIPTDFPKYGINELDVDVDNVNAELTQTKSKLAMLLDPSAFAEKDKKKREEKIKVAMNSANAVYEQYRENPHIIKDNRQRQLLENIDRLSDKKYTLVTKLDAANEAGAPYKNQTERVINQQNGVKVGNTRFSAKELYDFDNDAGKYIMEYKVKTRDGFVTRMQMKDDILKKYQGKKYYPIALALYNSFNNQNLSPDERVIVNQIKKINDATNSQVRELTRKQQAAESKAIYDLSPEFQQMNIQLNPDNKRDMNVVNQIIGLKLKDYNDRGALNTKRPDDFVPETIAEMTGEGKKPGYTYIKNYDGSATLIITEGQNVQKIPLTAKEFRNWVTDYSYVNPMSDVISAVQGSKYKTTNTAGTQQGSTARYTGNSPLLPGFNNTKMASKVRMDIEGSPDNTGDADTDVFQARLYYYDGNQWKDEIYNSGGYVDAANLQILLSQAGQKTIETLFK
jgi:hypothetical protein